jgi:hypothetical protein
MAASCCVVRRGGGGGSVPLPICVSACLCCCCASVAAARCVCCFRCTATRLRGCMLVCFVCIYTLHTAHTSKPAFDRFALVCACVVFMQVRVLLSRPSHQADGFSLRGSAVRAYTPHNPVARDESWYFFLTEPSSNAVLTYTKVRSYYVNLCTYDCVSVGTCCFSCLITSCCVLIMIRACWRMRILLALAFVCLTHCAAVSLLITCGCIFVLSCCCT